ncbi:hypothetical protein JMUB3936_p1006 (plasmid) [Leptotrichia wadei]|uniref:Uncharacterized protein n=1 Tax=Leptotrichia wadei TaxID=157687 RepID=A0A510KWA8_9FUSO|nr:hypothetical protein [Leptotrichia wadei]BBM55934.1 hypothetical protein JMUB3936_p1006 [Leptotrichia wadei]
MTRLINEFEFEDLHNPEQTVIKDFKNEFIIVHFRKMFEQELMEIKSKFKIYSKLDTIRLKLLYIKCL